MKRLVFLCWAALLFMCALPASAQQPPCRIPDDPAVVIELLFPVVDSDHSGGISLTEVAVFYPEITQPLFDIADTNRDGKVTKSELLVILAFLPISYSGYVDPNGDGVVYYAEVSEYLSQAQFAAIDVDHNGRIDCADFGATPGEGEPEGEGELSEGEVLPCPLPPDPLLLIEFLWPVVDGDGSGGLSLAEAQVFVEFATPEILAIADTNNDGEVDRAELLPFLPLIPPDFLGYIDINGDGLVDVYEVLNFTDAGVFFALDHNGNGYIDCGDLGDDPREGEPEGQTEGETEGGIDPNLDLCAYVQYFDFGFDFADTDGDKQVTLAEIEAALAILALPLPDLSPYFVEIDTDHSGGITRDEVDRVVARCGGSGEGEGEGEGEGGIDPSLEICDYVQYFEIGFSIADANNDGQLTRAEIEIVLAQLGIPLPDLTIYFPQLDTDNSGTISRDEVAGLIDRCNGGEGEGEGQDEGELGWVDPCIFLQLYGADAYPLYDSNGDFRLAFAELPAINFFVHPNITPEQAFAAADLNSDGYVDDFEFGQLQLQCGIGPEGEGAAEGEGEGGPGEDNPIAFRRSVDGNGRYAPGHAITIVEEISNRTQAQVTALGISDVLPGGWVIGEVKESAGATSAPAPGDSGLVEFAWLNVPAFPVRVVYTLVAPAGASGVQVLTGVAHYRIGVENYERSVSLSTAFGQGDGPEWCHDADRDRDWTISLSEALRLIQLYNSDGYHCDATTEDGFAPGPGDTGCAHHGTDYLTSDWHIDLSELLRLVQIYNSGGYYLLPGTEDGYAPGRFAQD